MIDRYTTPEMAQIWSEQNKFETWKKVEITVTEVLSDRGEVPKEAVKVINEKAAFTVERILEIEKVTHHDVIAFLTNMAENIGPESRFIHMGMTSSDLLDTSLALLCQEAGEIISPAFWQSSAKEVSNKSEEVIPMWINRDSGPIFSAILVRKAITS